MKAAAFFLLVHCLLVQIDAAPPMDGLAPNAEHPVYIVRTPSRFRIVPSEPGAAPPPSTFQQVHPAPMPETPSPTEISRYYQLEHTSQWNAQRMEKWQHMLALACLQGNTLVMQKLLQMSNEVNFAAPQEYQRYTPLAIAVIKGHKEAVEILLDVPGVDLNMGGAPDGYTPLVMAIRLQRNDLTNMLLRRGADARIRDTVRQRNALHHAVVYRSEFFVFKNLRKFPSLWNDQDAMGNTPLMLAAQKGNAAFLGLSAQFEPAEAVWMEAVPQIGRSLMKYAYRQLRQTLPPLQLNVQNMEGRTALHSAVRMGHAYIVQQLLQAGADPLLRDRKGKNSVDHALATRQLDMVHFFLSRQVPMDARQKRALQLLEQRKESASDLLNMGDLQIVEEPSSTRAVPEHRKRKATASSLKKHVAQAEHREEAAIKGGEQMPQKKKRIQWGEELDYLRSDTIE